MKLTEQEKFNLELLIAYGVDPVIAWRLLELDRTDPIMPSESLCLCGAPIIGGVCSVPGCVASPGRYGSHIPSDEP